MNTKNPREICRQFTISELINLLGVSKRTAERYQAGDSLPPKGFITLLELTHQQRIMPAVWPAHFRFTHDRLSTTTTREPLTWGTIEQYSWIINQWYTNSEYVAKVEKMIAVILPALNAQQVEEIEAMRERPTICANEEPYKRRARHMRRAAGC